MDFYPRHPHWMARVGEWLSLVEHLVRDQGVGGSNPLSPTIYFQADTRLQYPAKSPVVDKMQTMLTSLDFLPEFHLAIKLKDSDPYSQPSASLLTYSANRPCEMSGFENSTME